MPSDRFTALAAANRNEGEGWLDTSRDFPSKLAALAWLMEKADEGYTYRSVFDKDERRIVWAVQAR